ncbi:MAG: outer membrane beta-barrel protein [Bacteroidota bacterium]
MKQQVFLWIISVLLTAATLPAQVLDQGNFLIGSTIGLSVAQSNVKLQASSQKEEGEGPSSTQFNIAPNLGYFIIDQFAIGIAMDYTFSAIQEPNQDRNEDSNLLFGPFLRYYVPVGDDMAVFMQTDFGFGNATDNQLIDGERQRISSNIFALGLGPGFTIFSNSAIGIEALFKYNFARSQFDTEIAGVETTTTTRSNQFDLSIGLQFYFGGIQSVSGRTTPTRPGF